MMEVIVETFRQAGEPSSADLRARPLPGQGLDTTMRVRCSKAMRSAFPVGQRFKLWVMVSHREDGSPYLNSNPRDTWAPVTAEEARRFIAQTFGTHLRHP